MIFCLGVSFTSCKSVKYLKSEKIKIIPGVPNGTPVFRFLLQVEILENTKFQTIEVNTLPVKSVFSVTDMKTNLQSDNSKFYEAGKYKLQIEFPVNQLDESNKDVITLIYKQGNRIRSLKKKIEVVNELRLK